MDWEQFEHASIIHHAQKYDHQTWHWSRVPEKALYDAGYINSYNKTRMARIASNNKNPEKNPFRDIGFDGIAQEIVDNNNVYHGLQAKYYSKRLGAGKLGTFLSKLLLLHAKNPQSCGYLYHRNGLTRDFREDIMQHHDDGLDIIHEQLDITDSPDDPETISDMDETQYDLTESQRQNIDDLLANKKGKQLLHRPCGTGKTVVCGHVLKEKRPKRIVVMAPLRISVDNLYRRLPSFLNKHKVILVDSDAGGITDIDKITKLIEKSPKWVIFTTFKSARDILSTIDAFECDYVVVDEVHNITHNGILSEFVNKIPNGLCMTATPPCNIDKIIDIKNTVSYSLMNAIQDKSVCDYRVWIPLLIKTTASDYDIDMPIPDEFIELSKLATSQALFLSNGMLQTGSRKCIVYFRKISDCREFRRVFQQVLLEYHGLSCRIDKINKNTSQKKRKEILDIFDDPKNMGIHLLLSVRILDEAVDLKRCDSEFITYTGDSMRDIRVIQRMMRGCRIDPWNPNKVNNLFIWANVNDDKALRVFSLLKSMDASLTNKIHSMSSNYDAQNTNKIKKKISAQDGDCDGYIIKCMNLEELRIYKANLLLEYVGMNGTHPPAKCIYKRIKIGSFWTHIKHHKQNNDIYESMLKSNDILLDDYDRSQQKKKSNPTITVEYKAKLLLEYVNIHAEHPPQKFKYKDVKIGNFWYTTKQGNNKDIYESMLKSNFILRTDYDKCQLKKLASANKPKETPEYKSKLTLKYVNIYKTHPIQTCKYKGVKIGIFWSCIKKGCNKNIYKTMLKSDPILRADYDKAQNTKLAKAHKPKETPQYKAKLTLEYVNIYKTQPSSKCEYKDVKIGSFWGHIKDGSNKDIYESMLKSDNILRTNYNKAQKTKLENACKSKVTPKYRAQLTLEYVNIYKKHPPCDCEYNGIKIGNFWDSIKQGHNNTIYEKILRPNPILRANFDKTQNTKLEKADKPTEPPEYKAKLTLEYVNINGTTPPYSCEYKGEKIGLFWYNIKREQCKKIYDTKLKSNPILRADYDKHANR